MFLLINKLLDFLFPSRIKAITTAPDGNNDLQRCIRKIESLISKMEVPPSISINIFGNAPSGFGMHNLGSPYPPISSVLDNVTLYNITTHNNKLLMTVRVFTIFKYSTPLEMDSRKVIKYFYDFAEIYNEHIESQKEKIFIDILTAMKVQQGVPFSEKLDKIIGQTLGEEFVTPKEKEKDSDKVTADKAIAEISEMISLLSESK